MQFEMAVQEGFELSKILLNYKMKQDPIYHDPVLDQVRHKF